MMSLQTKCQIPRQKNRVCATDPDVVGWKRCKVEGNEELHGAVDGDGGSIRGCDLGWLPGIYTGVERDGVAVENW